MNNNQDLQRAIAKLHGAFGIHIASVPVSETLNDCEAWDGMVELFMLSGHPEAKTIYAWTDHASDPDTPSRHVTVLHLPPVDSPQAAVKVVMAGTRQSRAEPEM